MGESLLFYLSIGCYLTGALVTLLTGHARKLAGWLSLISVALGAICIWVLVIRVFSHGTISLEPSLWKLPEIGASLQLRIDHLSALFLAIISVMSVLVAFYSIDFMQLPFFQSLSLRAYYPVLLTFFASVLCVVTVADMFFFLIFWEIMTLTSYLLVIFRRTDPVRLRAGFKYFLITHIATALLMVATILLYQRGGSFSFTAQSQAMAGLLAHNPGTLHLVLLFLFLGFAAKAGILPMGDWLPDAYPAAPSPASAAFAGSMTKLGIYGLIRVFVDFLPVSGHSQTWGIVIALFGVLSIFVGTMTALVQEDTKRLLSFHVIGQMGYMFLGIGTGIYFLKSNPVLAMVSIGAGVFHLINHVSYKACLFFNAGSVFWKVGTRDINKVGGLASLLPITALTTVIASLSIAGIPPFSGFSSKWLIYQAAVKGGSSAPAFIFLGIVAIFISAVTLASFVKFFGSMFYGKYADNDTRATPGEVPWTMMVPQIVLSFFCILFGIIPLLPVRYVYAALIDLFPANTVAAFSQIYGASAIGALGLDFGQGVVAGWSPVIMVLITLSCLLIIYLLYRAAGAEQRVDETWYCGAELSDDQARYRAHSFYIVFKQMFRIRLGKYERPGVYATINYPRFSFTEKNIFKKIANLDDWFFNPLVKYFVKILERVRMTHSGIPHVYLLWLLIGAVAAVAVLFLL